MVSLSNLNPFKKKDNTYKLDEHSLPSLSDTMSNNPSQADSGLNPSQDAGLPDLGAPYGSGQSDNFSLNQPADQGMEMPQNFSLQGSQDASMNVNPGPLNSTSDNFHPSPFPEQPMPQTTDNSQNNQDIHSEISKHKIESMEAKVSLIDARLSNIEQKLELLNKLILEEISDETKRKLNVQSMMGNMKK